MIAIFSALVLSVGVLGTVYAQSAFAISQTATNTASNDGSNTAIDTNTATATSTGSGNGNGGSDNGNTVAHASSHTHQSIHVSAKSSQRASCDNEGNNGRYDGDGKACAGVARGERRPGKRQADNAAIVDAGPVLLILTTNSELIVARKSAKAFEVVRKYTVADSPTWAHPVVMGNGILIKDATTLALWSLS